MYLHSHNSLIQIQLYARSLKIPFGVDMLNQQLQQPDLIGLITLPVVTITLNLKKFLNLT